MYVILLLLRRVSLLFDMMNVDVNGNDVMAVSVYPKEGNPLWEQWSTKTVASALKSYSKMTFDYPYHKAGIRTRR